MDNRKEMAEIRAKRFDTEEMAQEVCNELNKHSMGETYCPLTKEQCRTDCECFVSANANQVGVMDPLDPYSMDERIKFQVGGFYCDNAMFQNND